jgi:hypothetical protein
MTIVGGSEDYNDTKAIAAWLWPRDEPRRSRAFNRAGARAGELVRSNWNLIARIADLLADCGYIDMKHPLLASFS